jgi:hypothetical protein
VQRLNAIEDGHVDIKKNDGHVMELEQVQGLTTVGCEDDLEALALESTLEQRSDPWVVVGDKDDRAVRRWSLVAGVDVWPVSLSPGSTESLVRHIHAPCWEQTIASGVGD